MKQDMNIAVIGAGIGGLATSIYLARHGHTVSVLERFPENKPLGAGLLLQPPGQEVLDELDILQEIKSQSAEILALKSKTSRGKTILDLKYQDLSGATCSGLGIERSLLHSALTNKAVESGVNIILSAEIKDVDIKSGRVSSATKSYGNYDIIIIANGARDVLCDKYIKRYKRQYRWSCLWANVTLPADCPPDVLSQRCKSSKYMIGLMPLKHNGDGSTSAAFFWSLRGRQLADWRAQTYQGFVQDVRAIWPSAADAIAPLSHNSFSHAIYYDSWSKKPWSNRVVTIGDAIHCTSPQLGQGATMALMDAKALASAISSHSDIEDAFKDFWARREKHLKFTRLMSRIVTPFFQSNSKLIGFTRDSFCHYFTKSGAGRRMALETLSSRREHLL